LRDAHRVAHEVQDAIVAAFPDAEVLIHPEPPGVAEPHPDFDV
jgi:ferrous-iron efflux pump FieF